MKTTFENCVILFGGSSEERKVSVASAQNLAQKLPETELLFLSAQGEVYKVSQEELAAFQDVFVKEFVPKSAPLSPNLKSHLDLMKGKTVIIALHGTEGEDGTIQKLFEERGIAFTGSGSKASALAFDKVETKKMAKEAGIQIVGDVVIKDFSHTELLEAQVLLAAHKKLVLKPLANGSSVGLYFVNSEAELNSVFDKISKADLGPYLIEPFISGREITVGVRQKPDGTVLPLPCSEVRVIEGRNFDYEGKYLGKGVEELTPAPLTPDESKKCQEVAVTIHKLLGCRGYTRTDMMLTKSGPVLLEINTLPGLSKASFIPQQIAANGENLRDFFREQINL